MIIYHHYFSLFATKNSFRLTAKIQLKKAGNPKLKSYFWDVCEWADAIFHDYLRNEFGHVRHAKFEIAASWRGVHNCVISDIQIIMQRTGFISDGGPEKLKWIVVWNLLENLMENYMHKRLLILEKKKTIYIFFLQSLWTSRFFSSMESLPFF